MIALDEDALICDMAETYHIYAMEQFPSEYIATLAVGLRDDSRIKIKLSGLNIDMKTLLLARIADNTAINVYLKTKDAKTGSNRPKSILEALTASSNENAHAREFETGEDFLKEWRRLNGN